MTGESNPIKVPQNAEESSAARDALAKVMNLSMLLLHSSAIQLAGSVQDMFVARTEAPSAILTLRAGGRSSTRSCLRGSWAASTRACRSRTPSASWWRASGGGSRGGSSACSTSSASRSARCAMMSQRAAPSSAVAAASRGCESGPCRPPHRGIRLHPISHGAARPCACISVDGRRSRRQVFEQNSFEQLCINYANETLQQQFINQMLHSMMAQYRAEGVQVAAIPFEDNSPCVELLESKMGILALLDDECNFPKGSDEDFLHKLMDRHRGHSHLKRGGSSSDPYLKEGAAAGGKLAASSARVQSARECFVISHFAGEVEYSVAGFLDKNRDTINESLKAVLKAVQQQLLSVVLGERDPASVGAEGEGDGEGGSRSVGARRVGGAARAQAGRWVGDGLRLCSLSMFQ